MDATPGSTPPHSDLIPAYALGALDPEDARAFEAHLRGCQECQAALAEYQRIAEGLLFALPPSKPPPALRRRLAEQVAKDRPAAKPARRAWSFSQMALGLAVLVLLSTNALLALQVRSLQSQQARLLREIQENQTALAFVAQPNLRTLPVSGQTGQGSLAIDPGTGRGALFLSGLPPLDEAHAYQVWLIPAEGSPVSAGIFRSEPEQPYIYFPVAAGQPIEDFAALGVTVEPEAGSPAPTTEPILLAEI